MPVVRVCRQCGAKNRVPGSHLADSGRCGACKKVIAPLHEPIAVDVELFDEIIHTAKVPVLVDFWAEWCGPCKMAAPEVARVAANMAGEAVVLKVDTEQYPQLAQRFFVRGIPNFAVFMNGSLIQQQAGVVSHQQLEAWLREAQGGVEERRAG